MPPPGYEPFLRAICESPDDDVPRLVYADWLDETGESERAEFIRLQVADPDRADRPDVTDREFELRHQNREVWRAELPVIPGVNWGRFRRGFVSGATFTEWRFFHRHADAVFAAAPVDEVRFRELNRGQWAVFVLSPHLSRVRRLDTGTAPLGDAELRQLVHSPRAGRLEELSFGGYVPEPVGLNWPQGRRSLLTDNGISSLFWAEGLPLLRKIVLRSEAISPEAAAALRQRYGPGVVVTR